MRCACDHPRIGWLAFGCAVSVGMNLWLLLAIQASHPDCRVRDQHLTERLDTLVGAWQTWEQAHQPIPEYPRKVARSPYRTGWGFSR